MGFPGASAGRAAGIPTKTPLMVGQLAGRLSSSWRQLPHVPFKVPLSRVFFLNLASLVSILSVVNHLFMVFVHLFIVSLSGCTGPPSFLVLCSFLIYHIRYAISDVSILYRRFFLLSGFSSWVKVARLHPIIPPSVFGRSVVSPGP